MAISFTRIGRSGDGAAFWAGARLGLRTTKEKKMERTTLPRAVIEAIVLSCGEAASGRSVLREREPRFRDLGFPEDEIGPLHVELQPSSDRDLAPHHGFPQRVLPVLLDRPPKLAGPVLV